ncbi:MAG: hypothetical protein JXA96_10225 [Sedimentisphaerales bacterium]|nr:hypothetical protein [Sedimentisphaerales bacterium]
MRYSTHQQIRKISLLYQANTSEFSLRAWNSIISKRDSRDKCFLFLQIIFLTFFFIRVLKRKLETVLMNI